ncbi:PepSY domain-containing protein [Methylomicrobium sp. Wu6]|uniref:PepSY domain-containing protein n=1 Tax=Methylomicrobium sp. Wu6 TaxID=3107928 RepID=UPI002DD6A4F3|nr:PepSY domain-containing protein [Methylomicrobium sp. Wu6]MEC4748424.1 PepSY domain-containing protein [Methylomicrobium sp. Wu6]
MLSAVVLSVSSVLNAQAADEGLEKCVAAAQAIKKGDMLKLEKLDIGGKPMYELEIRDAQGMEWEFMCDANSGKITEQESEVSNADDKSFKSKMKVGEKEAADIALKAHPGKIVEAEYEIEENGDASYEFDIVGDKGMETKVEVDAATGKIIETSIEEWEIGEEKEDRR